MAKMCKTVDVATLASKLKMLKMFLPTTLPIWYIYVNSMIIPSYSYNTKSMSLRYQCCGLESNLLIPITQ